MKQIFLFETKGFTLQIILPFLCLILFFCQKNNELSMFRNSVRTYNKGAWKDGSQCLVFVLFPPHVVTFSLLSE